MKWLYTQTQEVFAFVTNKINFKMYVLTNIPEIKI